MLRKSLAIAVLGIFLFDSCGFMLGWQLRLWMHTVMVEQIIRSDFFSGEITVIRLTADEFEKAKIHDREFSLNGEMFDVVLKETDGDDLVLFCYRDTGEEQLIVELVEFITNKTDDTASQRASLIQSFFADFVLFPPDRINQFTAPLNISQFYLPFILPTLCQIRHVDLPPPRFQSC